MAESHQNLLFSEAFNYGKFGHKQNLSKTSLVWDFPSKLSHNIVFVLNQMILMLDYREETCNYEFTWDIRAASGWADVMHCAINWLLELCYNM